MTQIIWNVSVIGETGILEKGWVCIRDGIIQGIFPGVPEETIRNCAELCIDGGGGYLSPGFIDLHVHGGADGDFLDQKEENFLRALRAHFLGGTTTILPTLMSADQEGILAAGENYRRIQQRWETISDIPRLGGLHLEGPYFSEKQLGAQDKTFVRDPEPEEYREILEKLPFIVRWSAACELPGALPFGEELAKRGITACIGHSDATTEQVRRGVAHGYRCVTHLYSSCSMVHRNGPYREGGIVEAAFLMDELDVEMIGDGIHLPPDFLKLIHKIKGPEHIALITDCIRPGGRNLPDETWTFSDEKKNRPVVVRGGVAVMPDNTCFAGSVATMNQVVKACVQKAGLPLLDVVKMASATPAGMLGLSDRGSIAPGKLADLLILDRELNVKTILLSRGKEMPRAVTV